MGLRNLLLNFWDPLHISGTVEARNLKFGTQIFHQGYYRKKCEIRSKWVVKASRDLLLEFLVSLHILGSVEVEARNVKFGTQIDYCGT